MYIQDMQLEYFDMEREMSVRRRPLRSLLMWCLSMEGMIHVCVSPRIISWEQREKKRERERKRDVREREREREKERESLLV